MNITDMFTNHNKLLRWAYFLKLAHSPFCSYAGAKDRWWWWWVNIHILCGFLGYDILYPRRWVTVFCVNLLLLSSGLKQVKLVKCLVMYIWRRWNMKHIVWKQTKTNSLKVLSTAITHTATDNCNERNGTETTCLFCAKLRKEKKSLKYEHW
jgi:hypothetical protein